MDKQEFITKMAGCVQKYAPQYGINVCSPVIAQAILESASGTSFKAQYHNYFGLKYRTDGRCPVASGKFVDTSKEDRSGTLETITDYWFSFDSMENGVEGYFQWTNISNYANLKGVTDPEQYLINIKLDHYATSTNYVKNLMNVIKTYNLTQYDTDKDNGKMIINVHAGHNPDGTTACGAVGLIKESTEARAVKDKVIALLQAKGHTVRDCTCNNGTSQSDVLKKIVAECNAVSADLDISIHFNAGAKDPSGNGATTGCECYIYPGSAAKDIAANICSKISALGFKNRGVKESNTLYVLKNTKAPAILVECCFVDDADDVHLYTADEMATAIVEGITGIATSQKEEENSNIIYRVQVGAYSIKDNAIRKADEMSKLGIKTVIIED